MKSCFHAVKCHNTFNSFCDGPKKPFYTAKYFVIDAIRLHCFGFCETEIELLQQGRSGTCWSSRH